MILFIQTVGFNSMLRLISIYMKIFVFDENKSFVRLIILQKSHGNIVSLYFLYSTKKIIYKKHTSKQNIVIKFYNLPC